MYTADRLYDAVMMDVWPTAGALVDFGIDSNRDLYAVYQQKVRSGEVTLEALRRASGDGPKLSALIGQKVVTAYDMMLAP